MQRIHIVGCGPRTGTTLIAEMMAACFEIDLYPKHESSIYTRPTRPAKIFLTKRPRDILENVTPDFSPSHWEEYFTKEELARRLKWKYIKPIFALLPHFSYRANNQANP